MPPKFGSRSSGQVTITREDGRVTITAPLTRANLKQLLAWSTVSGEDELQQNEAPNSVNGSVCGDVARDRTRCGEFNRNLTNILLTQCKSTLTLTSEIDGDILTAMMPENLRANLREIATYPPHRRHILVATPSPNPRVTQKGVFASANRDYNLYYLSSFALDLEKERLTGPRGSRKNYFAQLLGGKDSLASKKFVNSLTTKLSGSTKPIKRYVGNKPYFYFPPGGDCEERNPACVFWAIGKVGEDGTVSWSYVNTEAQVK